MYLTKPKLHVSALCISLMIVCIRKSKHVVEVVKHTRYTSRVNRDSSVGIVTGYGLDGPGIESR